MINLVQRKSFVRHFVRQGGIGLPRQRVQVWLPMLELSPLNAAYAREAIFRHRLARKPRAKKYVADCRCIEDLNEGKPGVPEEIASWASRFTAQGWTTLELAYIAPTLKACGSEALLTAIEGRYDIVAGNLRELFSHADYCSKF